MSIAQKRMSKKRRFAPESARTQRVREKLKKYWSEMDHKVTPEALRKTIEEIHRWIASHAKNRVLLKNKKISLFDENQNAAKVKRRVRAIAQRLQAEMQKF